MYRIELFGQLRVIHGDTVVSQFPSQKAAALLAYLAYHGDRAHTREQLSTLLWPDADPQDGRNSLKQEMARLRRLLHPEESEAISPIAGGRQSVSIDLLVVSIDTAEFEVLLRKAAGTTDPAARSSLLLEAIALYRGELAPGIYEEWAVRERERLTHSHSVALRQAARDLNATGDWDRALACSRKAVEADPLSEECCEELMRLCISRRRPGEALREYQKLERLMREQLSTAPGAVTRALAASCRTQSPSGVGPSADGTVLSSPASLAGERLDAPERADPVPDAEQGAFQRSEAGPVARDVKRSRPGGRRRVTVFLAILSVLILACSAGIWYWKAFQQSANRKWAFLYQPRPGENRNAEGRAVAADSTGIYATGFIQTEKEDVDILTLKLSPTGKLLWVKRYSSPEHDCDRPSSICVGASGDVYVGGETYVPKGHGSPEGWFLTLLHYDRNGGSYWARRSVRPIHHGQWNIQVLDDRHGGCTICGTSLIDGKHGILAMRCDRSGARLWEKTLSDGLDTRFGQAVCGSDGSLTLCGTALRVAGSGKATDDWMVVSLDPAGNPLWTRYLDRPGHGNDVAGAIGLDPAGNVLVAGVVDTGDAAHGGQGQNLALAKFSPVDGNRMLFRIASNTGPIVTMSGLRCNRLGDVVLGGNLRRTPAASKIILVRYDRAGNLVRTWPYPMPPGYENGGLQNAGIDDRGNVEFLGQITRGSAFDMAFDSALVIGAYSPDGSLVRQELYRLRPGRLNYGNSEAPAFQSHIAIAGQAGLESGDKAFLVLLR